MSREKNHRSGAGDFHRLGETTRMQNRIREHRERLGWSQEKLARLTDTSTQQISRLEKSQRRLADDWLKRLAAAMGVSKADLLTDALVTSSAPPRESDLIEDDTERTLLDFWRRLTPEAQDVILAAVDAWANNAIRRSGGH